MEGIAKVRNYFRSFYGRYRMHIDIKEDNFVDVCTKWVNDGVFESAERLADILMCARFDVSGVARIVKVCGMPNSKIRVSQIDPSCYCCFDARRFDEFVDIIDIVNRESGSKKITGNLHSYSFVSHNKICLDTLKNWIKSEDEVYKELKNTYRAYLASYFHTYECGKRFKELLGEDVEVGEVSDLGAKIVVRPKKDCVLPDGQESVICACLNDVKKGENLNGRFLYDDILSVKSGKNPRLARFLESEYGVTRDMLITGETELDFAVSE